MRCEVWRCGVKEGESRRASLSRQPPTNGMICRRARSAEAWQSRLIALHSIFSKKTKTTSLDRNAPALIPQHNHVSSSFLHVKL